MYYSLFFILFSLFFFFSLKFNKGYWLLWNTKTRFWKNLCTSPHESLSSINTCPKRKRKALFPNKSFEAEHHRSKCKRSGLRSQSCGLYCKAANITKGNGRNRVLVAIIAFNRIFRWKASKIINWRLFGNQTDSDIFFENREEWKDLIRVHYPQRFLENTSFLLILAKNENPVTKVAGFLLFVPIDLSRYKW